MNWFDVVKGRYGTDREGTRRHSITIENIRLENGWADLTEEQYNNFYNINSKIKYHKGMVYHYYTLKNQQVPRDKLWSHARKYREAFESMQESYNNAEPIQEYDYFGEKTDPPIMWAKPNPKNRQSKYIKVK